jgi:hypothetical protein
VRAAVPTVGPAPAAVDARVRFFSAEHLSRYLPVAATALVCLGVLARYGTPVPVAVWYVLYAALLVALPGTLVWRRVRRGGGSFVEDVAVGAALGLAVQVLLAFALAPLGLSPLSWVWAPLVIGLSLLPSQRALVWSRPGPATTSRVHAWLQGAAVSAGTVWLGATSIAHNPLAWVDGRGPWSRAVPSSAYVDLPFHHAIAAGIDRTYPLVYPYLYDEPLSYHLFVYEHLAGVSRASGIDLTWVLYRLDPAAMVALGVVLAGVLARRLSGRPVAAPLAAVVVTLSSAVSVYGWTRMPFQDPGFLHFATYRSPTHTFGMALFLATVTVCAVLLRDRLTRQSVPVVAVFTVLALAAGGSKSTFLPVLACGLLLVTGVELLRRRRDLAVTALVLSAIACLGFVAAIVVLLRGQSGSLAIAPLTIVRTFAAAPSLAASGAPAHTQVVLVLALFSWLCAGAGVVLLWTRRRLADPAFWLIAGIVVAGFAACLLTSANGLSQLYFLYAAWPMLGILTTWGLVEASADAPRSTAVVAFGALPVGAALVWLVRRADGIESPTYDLGGFPYRDLVGPWLLLLAACLVVGCVVGVVARAWGGRSTRAATMLGAVALVGLVAGSSLSLRAHTVLTSAVDVVRGTPAGAEGWSIPGDGALAALEVRDLSEPDDVVATNAHCYGPPEACDARHFWVSALTERRTLLEGWAYPEGFRPGQTRTSPFWDQERYARNEAVFEDPSQAAVDLLADEYGVRWLLVDRTLGRESPDLRRYAELVSERPDAAVYRIG